MKEYHEIESDIATSISKRLTRGVDEWIEKLCRTVVEPIIKGEMTANKVTWRGLHIETNHNGNVIVYTLRQRDKQVGESYIIDIV